MYLSCLATTNCSFPAICGASYLTASICKNEIVVGTVWLFINSGAMSSWIPQFHFLNIFMYKIYSKWFYIIESLLLNLIIQSLA